MIFILRFAQKKDYIKGFTDTIAIWLYHDKYIFKYVAKVLHTKFYNYFYKWQMHI